jgi:hypothetical protein
MRANLAKNDNSIVKPRKKYGYWLEIDNQIKHWNTVASKLKIVEPSQWYKVNWRELYNQGSGPLLKLYNNSIYDALKSAYPNICWQPWQFETVPKGTFSIFLCFILLLKVIGM